MLPFTELLENIRYQNEKVRGQGVTLPQPTLGNDLLAWASIDNDSGGASCHNMIEAKVSRLSMR